MTATLLELAALAVDSGDEARVFVERLAQLGPVILLVDRTAKVPAGAMRAGDLGPGVTSVGHCFEPNGTAGGRNAVVSRLALSAMMAARASPPINS